MIYSTCGRGKTKGDHEVPMKHAINLFQLTAICVRRVSMKRTCVAVSVLLWLFLAATPSHAQWIKKEDLKGDFVDGEPFDLVFLNEAGRIRYS